MYPEQRQTSSSTTVGNLDKQTINRLFATMKLAYPNFMLNQEETDLDATKRMWYSHLLEFSDKAIEQCARLMIDKYPSKAPTLGQFKKMLEEIDGYRKEAIEHRPLEPCPVCRALPFSRYHEEICVKGTARLPMVTDEQIAHTKRMFSKLR